MQTKNVEKCQNEEEHMDTTIKDELEVNYELLKCHKYIEIIQSCKYPKQNPNDKYNPSVMNISSIQQ